MSSRLVLTPFGILAISQQQAQELELLAALGPLANLVHDRRSRQSSEIRDGPSRCGGNTRVLYHQTDEASAHAILSSQRMLRGSAGLAGGVVLRCTVELGRVKTLGSSGDASATFASLRQEGYDSVCIVGRSSGTEYAVYNYDQIRRIELA